MTTANLNSSFAAWRTVLAACVLVGTCAAARAETPGTTVTAAQKSDTRSVVVTYHDLDIATTQGSVALFERITQAAHQVCAVSDIRVLASVSAGHVCERAAVSQALDEVHSAPLAALRVAYLQRG